MSDPGGTPRGSLVLLHDITEETRAQAQLVVQGRALAALEERHRLGRDLHDSIGQVLGYVGYQAGAARKLYQDGLNAQADAQLERLAVIAHDAHADVREFILNLRTGSFPERAKQFGGRLALYSAAGSGTRIVVEIPLQQAAA